MSSQSAKYRTTANAAVGRTQAPARPEKAGDKSAQRVSWLWIGPIATGAWLLMAHVVPAAADWLAEMTVAHL